MSKLPTQFFGGESSSIGSVHLLHVKSWAQFVKEILGHPAVLNVTREQFHALPPKERNAAKRVRFVTPATFKKSHRVYESVLSISLVILDIDDTVQAARLLASMDTLRAAMGTLAFAVYTTASSTPRAPKLRVIVPAAQPFRAARYPHAVRKLAIQLGLPNVTTESKVMVQPMYLPTIFRGDDLLDIHPLVCARLEGEPMSDEGDADTPEAGQMSEPGDLDNLRATVDNVTEDDVKGALKHLSPDCSMADWISTGASLRHQFGPEVGFRLWNEWSAKGKKYDGEESTRKRWRYIRATPSGRAPVTLRTLLYKATDAGWKGMAELSERLYVATTDWINSAARTGPELTREGVKRIAACNLSSSTQKSALLSCLQRSLKKVGVRVTPTSLKKDLKYLEKSAPGAQPAAPETDVPQWAKGLSYVQGADEFYQRLSDSRYSPEVLDRSFSRKLMPQGPTDSGMPAIKPTNYLLNTLQIPIVSHYQYDPTRPEDTFVEYAGRRYINTYLPTYPEADPSQSKEAEDVFTQHLCHLIAEPHYRRTALDFLAYCVQHPGDKIRWAWLMQGAEGCGKTAIVEMMRAVLGENNARVLDSSLLFSGYNPWATGAQLVGMEEIRVVGHNRYEVMNRLKPCISNDTIVINRKYADLQHVKNVTNYIMFTNHHDSLALSPGDRRYFVVYSPMQTKADVAKLGGRAYFDRLFGVIQDKAGGLRHWLENHKISPTFSADGEAPTTRYLTDLSLAASTPLTASIRDALLDCDHPLVKKDLLSTRSLKATIMTENMPRFSDQQLALALRELDYVQVARARLGEDHAQHTLWAKRGSKLTKVDVCVRAANARVDGRVSKELV